jgi:anti-sigma regulatory factor (Ser/Thr protein kinase)/ABC-type transporter Mla MlaB component
VVGICTFRVDSTRAGSRRTIAASGELDSGSCSALTDAFERAASESVAGDAGPRRASGGDAGPGRAGRGELHLDLSALTFIDSAGLRAIIQLERGARERALPLVVTPPPAPVLELLELAGVADRLTLSPQQGQLPRSRPFVERVEVELAADLSAPSRARAEVRQVADSVLDETAFEAAVLLTSELVANAVIHPPSASGACVGLLVTCYENGIRCEISDRGPGFDPTTLAPRVSETGGRGLMLVDALASRWGTHRPSEEEGFCVWFELENEGELAADAAA